MEQTLSYKKSCYILTSIWHKVFTTKQKPLVEYNFLAISTQLK